MNTPGAAFHFWSRPLEENQTSGAPGAKWVLGGNQGIDGVYYIYRGSAEVGGNPGEAGTPWRTTIFAEGTFTGAEPNHCPHTGGDIVFGGNPRVSPHESAHPLLFVAGRDLRVSGNPNSEQINYEGALVAHEQGGLDGNVRVTNGVMITNDYCDTPGSPVTFNGIITNGNPTVTYNGDLEIPIGRFIRIVRWLEI
jgi:hypothetical protein